MGRLERHISNEALARAKARIAARERGEALPVTPKPRCSKSRPRRTETYRFFWRNEGLRANVATIPRPMRQRGRAYPYGSTKRGWGV